MRLSRRQFLQVTAGAAAVVLVPFASRPGTAAAGGGTAVVINPDVYGFSMDGYRMAAGEWAKSEIGQGNMDLETTFTKYGSAVLFYAKGEGTDATGTLRPPGTGYQLEFTSAATRLVKISDSAPRKVLRSGPAVAPGAKVVTQIRGGTYTVRVDGSVLLASVTDTSFYNRTAPTYRRMYLRQLTGTGVNSLKVTPR
jgi:hypothetical protein